MTADDRSSSFFDRYNDQAYLNGRLEAVIGASSRPIVNPATETNLGSVAETPRATIDLSVREANAAQRTWSTIDVNERTRILHETSTKIRENAELIARLITLEMGKPLQESMEEVLAAAPVFGYFAEMARNDQGRIIGSGASNQLHFVTMEPMGVSVHIVPYNYPILLLAWGLAGSLAAGNAAIVKPSEFTTASTLCFVEKLACLPAGLLQVVPGGAEVGRSLVGHQGTHVVAFTGSVSGGKAVASSCAALFKRCTIEASGSDPFIVLPSANLESAVDAAVVAGFANCGQVCTAAERFYVHEDLHDQFVEMLVQRTASLKIGPGLNGAQMGPLVSSTARERHERLIETAVKEGARIAYGAGRPAHHNKGWFVEPTVLTSCDVTMDLFRHEAFSPLAPIVKIRSFEEAIKFANASEFGLGATVFTEDLSEGLAASKFLNCGVVSVNSVATDSPAAPFGGRKLSGTGVQLGPQGLDAYRVAKQTMITHRALLDGGRQCI